MLVTVFTATYNRAYLLPRLYESLRRQRNTDFEWLIVDDASTDDTASVVGGFQSEQNEFPIVYLWQEHGGKHRAVNKGLGAAKGEFFLMVDSDDYLTDNAIDLINKWTKTIEGDSSFCGVAGTKVFSDGRVIGDALPVDDYIDARNRDRRKKHLMGDKSEVYKTECMRRHPFPEFENEFFLSEGYCWNAIDAEGLRLRWFNQPLQVCEYLEDGLSRSGVASIEGKATNFKGYCAVLQQAMVLKPWTESYRDFRVYQRVCKLKNLTPSDCAKSLNWSLVHYFAYCWIAVPFIHVVKRIQNLLIGIYKNPDTELSEKA